MRRAIVAGLLIAVGWAAPAIAGGSGNGGVCYQQEPMLDAGWVAVLDNCFSPNHMQMQAGDTIRWRADGLSPHTVTFENGPDQELSGGGEIPIRFNEPGVYTYVCRLHPGMNGVVEIGGTAKAGPAFEVLEDSSGLVIESFGLGSAKADGTDPQTMLIRLDPVLAVIVVMLFFPLTAGMTLRLIGFRHDGRRAARIRFQLPWRRELAPDTD